MHLPSLRSALLLPLLLATGCFADCSGIDLGDELLDVGTACEWEVGEGTIATDGEATVHPAIFTSQSPEIVARGALVTVVVRLPGDQADLVVSTEGAYELVDAGSPRFCEPGGGAGGGDGVGGDDGAGGGDGASGPAATHVQVTFRAGGEGALVLDHGDGATSRWSPLVREAAEVTLTVDDPGSCTVGGSCIVNAQVTDAAGAVLYAEQDVSWSAAPEPASGGNLYASYGFEPAGPGAVTVSADVLGLHAEVAIEVP